MLVNTCQVATSLHTQYWWDSTGLLIVATLFSVIVLFFKTFSACTFIINHNVKKWFENVTYCCKLWRELQLQNYCTF